jgi:hypothetical protein
MTPELPPPDPHEITQSSATGGQPIAAPTVVFARGAASPETDRVADALLDLRPGLLIVLAA